MKRDSLITSELILEVLASVYSEHKHPKLVHYEQAVAKLKCEKLNLAPDTYTHRQVHTSVWRSMNELVQSGEVIKDGIFYYGKEEYEDYCGKNDFKKYIFPADENFVLLTDNTVAVKLAEVCEHSKINNAVIQKFSESRVYASFVCDNVLVIIFYRDACDKNCLIELKTALTEARMYYLLSNETNLVQYFRNNKR